MPTGLSAGPSWRPYLILLLTPLTLVSLDSYGWIFTKPPLANQAFGLWPRQLQADTPWALSLILPPHAAAPDQLQLLGPLNSTDQAAKSTLPAHQQGKHWSTQLPSLQSGHYRLQPLLKGLPHGPAQDLKVHPKPSWQLRLDRTAYVPGDWMVLSTRLLTPSHVPLRLDVRGPDQSLLLSHPLSREPGLQTSRLHLPASPGIGTVMLMAGSRPLETQHYQIQPEQLPLSAQGQLQLLSQRIQLLANQDQNIELCLLDAQGQPVETGSLRILGKTLNVSKGKVKLELKATELSESIHFAAGDSRGNLLQGSLAFELLKADWLLQLSNSGQPELLSTRSLEFTWLLGQGNRILAQGQELAKAGLQPLNLGNLPAEGPMLWLRLCSELGECRQIRWQPVTPTSQWPISPAKPHALEPARVQPPTHLNGQLESFRLQQLGMAQLTLPPGRAVAWSQAVGLPKPQPERPAWLTLWCLAGLLAASVPLLWAWRRLGSKPFPDPARRRQATAGQLIALTTCGLALGGLVLTWFQQHQTAAMFGGLLALSGGLITSWQLRTPIKASRNHPLTAWMPLLQSLQWLLLAWFMTTYQPGLIGSGLLLLALFALGWSALWQRLIPMSRLQAYRLLGLASVAVACGAQILLQMGGVMQPHPGWLNARSESELSLNQLSPRSRLIDHHLLEANAQILPAARRSGPQALRWRIWQPNGGIQTFTQDQAVAPAVLLEANFPAYALLHDQLDLPIKLLNETHSAQATEVRFNGQSQSHDLAPRSLHNQTLRLSFDQPGWQDFELSHRFGGQWYSQHHKLFVMTPAKVVTDSRLQLQVDLPKHKQLVVGEEIPVIVRISHSLGRSTALGIQIGLPSSFEALTDTFNDGGQRKWLAGFQHQAGGIHLQTKPLATGEEISFHFRLQSSFGGSFQMPPARLFVRDQPQVQTLGPQAIRLEVLSSEP